MNTPLVTVLMSVHNGAPFLPDAIESVLKQTWTDFEFIIINDGSTDNSLQIIKSYNDSRIQVIDQDNIGLAGSLNKGINLAKGELIARMDADDISLSHRLERQVKFMKDNPSVDVCGSWVKTFGGGKETIWTYPETDEEIKAALIFSSPLPHPVTMIRKDIFNTYKLSYDQSFKCAQDYDLWVRSAPHVVFANLQEVLLEYRTHSSNTGKLHSGETERYSIIIRERQLDQLGVEAGHAEKVLHNKLSYSRFEYSRDFVMAARAWLERLIQANMLSKVYPATAFRRTMARKWFTLCLLQEDGGWWARRVFYSSPMFRDAGLLLREHVYIFLRASIGKRATDWITDIFRSLRAGPGG